MKSENIQYLSDLFGQMCKDIIFKCAATSGLLISQFFFDSILAKAMLGLFILIIFDWFTGVYASKVTGEAIKSLKIVRTPIKIAIYFMLITCARIAEYSLPEVVRYLDDTVISFLAITELISVLENVGKMGYVVPQKLLGKLKSWRDEK